MKRFLFALLLLCCTALPTTLSPLSANAQTVVTLPYAANAVADLGNGPIKTRLVSGNASIFTAQGSGLGGTSGSSTTLTLTTTPATAPLVGALISGAGITSGTTVAAYNGTTGITLSAAMTVPASTPVAWGAACPSSSAGIPSVAYIQASVSAGYYLMYTQARVCAVSPGGPVNTLLIEPIYNEVTVPTVPQTIAKISHQWLDSYAASIGLFTQSQPACGDLSNAAASCSNDATNASNIGTGTLAAARQAPVPLATGSSTGNTLTGPFGYFVCTAICTVTPPVPVAGYQFCVMNDDNASGAITLGALGSSARYENTARTAYGTAGTGTLVSGGAVGDMICIVGRDSTHYLSPTFVGTWTAS